MAAKLHVICGNCGSAEHLTYERDFLCEDSGDLSCIKCENCATIHYLQDINQ